MSHTGNKHYVYTLKQTAGICFNYSWLNGELPSCSMLEAMQQGDS